MKIFMILGNGFSVDCLNESDQKNTIFSNFFKYGADVPWPANMKPGFLSAKYCPNLWLLGARPSMPDKEAMELIEDIISCANTTYSSRIKSGDEKTVYHKAYIELTEYLRSLFIWQGSKIDFSKSKNINWSKFFYQIHKNPKIESINIMTLNYDCILENILGKKSIPFKMPIIKENSSKFRIFKPHGSISFSRPSSMGSSSYMINYDRENADHELKDLNLLDKPHEFSMSLLTPIIPPAGDAGRLSSDKSWSATIRKELLTTFKTSRKNDLVIISGISYWHVDRPELDEILCSIDREASIVMLNPSPSRTMVAVLTSLFKNLTIFNDSKQILEIAK